jgi:hypothetical protein
MEELRLQFVGDKAKLKKQLKIWCAKNGKQMTPTIMELIKEHLQNKNKKYEQDKNPQHPQS